MDPYYIIDTDMGVDDLLACCIAIKHIKKDRLMFTTVHGNTSEEHASENLSILLTMMDSDIPFYEGAKSSLIS